MGNIIRFPKKPEVELSPEAEMYYKIELEAAIREYNRLSLLTDIRGALVILGFSVGALVWFKLSFAGITEFSSAILNLIQSIGL